MSSDFNQVILIGRLGQDPKSRTLDNGTFVCRFSMATSETWKDKDGEKQEKTSWHNVVLWRRLGEIAQQYLRKGSKVQIVGKVNYRTGEYEGTKRDYTDIVADKMIMLDGKPRNDQQYPTADEAPPVRQAKVATAVGTEKDSHIPF